MKDLTNICLELLEKYKEVRSEHDKIMFKDPLDLTAAGLLLQAEVDEYLRIIKNEKTD